MSDKKCYIIPFGSSQLPGIGFYTTVYAENREEAREKINAVTNRWSFMYNSKDDAGVEKYNLTHVDLVEVERMVTAAKLY